VNISRSLTAEIGVCAFILPALLLYLPPAPLFSAQYEGIFRVNSKVSSGADSIERIADDASKQGMDFVVLSDQMMVRAEYGLPPFRNVMKRSLNKPDVLSYGVKDYIERIKSADAFYPTELIVGVDLAPHYYWTGSLLGKNLCNRQFSQQMTIFGSEDADFYAKMPFLHSNAPEENAWLVLLRLSPLLLSLNGILILASAFRTRFYEDRQGNTYSRPARLQKILALALIALGLLWTVDMRPFKKKIPFDQYSKCGRKPYQDLIDYVRARGGSLCGVVWSAPEAKSVNIVSGVPLISMPYLNDVAATRDHNGLAGIYADRFTAHLSGHEWDTMLDEFCRGERKTLPALFGELDYHGSGDRPIDIIKIVAIADDAPPGEERKNKIIQALLSGSSYSLRKGSSSEMRIRSAQISDGMSTAGPGGSLETTRSSSLNFKLEGRLSPSGKGSTSISVVLNGRLRCCAELPVDSSGEFQLELRILPDDSSGMQYLRFWLESPDSGILICNPIFMKIVSE